MKKKICSVCGTLEKPKKQVPGHFLIELVLWLSFIIPGLLYSLWRISSKYHVCRSCGSRNIIDPDSPAGQKLLKEYNQAS